MNLQEKNLYQQIHPIRIATDWLSGFYACYLFWQHEPIPALVMAFIPSLVVSLFVVKNSDLEKLKNSAFGRYYKRIYSKSIDLVRFAGFVVMSVSSWYQEWSGIILGVLIVLATWIYGLFTKS